MASLLMFIFMKMATCGGSYDFPLCNLNFIRMDGVIEDIKLKPNPTLRVGLNAINKTCIELNKNLNKFFLGEHVNVYLRLDDNFDCFICEEKCNALILYKVIITAMLLTGTVMVLISLPLLVLGIRINLGYVFMLGGIANTLIVYVDYFYYSNYILAAYFSLFVPLILAVGEGGGGCHIVISILINLVLICPTMYAQI